MTSQRLPPHVTGVCHHHTSYLSLSQFSHVGKRLNNTCLWLGCIFLVEEEEGSSQTSSHTWALTGCPH